MALHMLFIGTGSKLLAIYHSKQANYIHDLQQHNVAAWTFVGCTEDWGTQYAMMIMEKKAFQILFSIFFFCVKRG